MSDNNPRKGKKRSFSNTKAGKQPSSRKKPEKKDFAAAGSGFAKFNSDRRGSGRPGKKDVRRPGAGRKAPRSSDRRDFGRRDSDKKDSRSSGRRDLGRSDRPDPGRPGSGRKDFGRSDRSDPGRPGSGRKDFGRSGRRDTDRKDSRSSGRRDFGRSDRPDPGRPGTSELRTKAFERSWSAITRKLSSRDALIIQSINTIDELDKCLNLLSERMREWYSLHFPELNTRVRDHKAYAKLALEGERKNIENKELQKLIEKSRGAEFKEADYHMMQSFAARVISLYELRDATSSYLKELMETEAPNINNIVASSIGARLIALSGGLENMTRMPAGTIQVLGAERALFRHLKTNADPPKYGILFQMSEVNSAPKEKRGKVARAVAAKLAIASKVDFFSKRLEPSIKEKLDARLRNIREKN